MDSNWYGWHQFTLLLAIDPCSAASLFIWVLVATLFSWYVVVTLAVVFKVLLIQADLMKKIELQFTGLWHQFFRLHLQQYSVILNKCQEVCGVWYMNHVYRDCGYKTSVKIGILLNVVCLVAVCLKAVLKEVSLVAIWNVVSWDVILKKDSLPAALDMDWWEAIQI